MSQAGQMTVSCCVASLALAVCCYEDGRAEASFTAFAQLYYIVAKLIWVGFSAPDPLEDGMYMYPDICCSLVVQTWHVADEGNSSVVPLLSSFYPFCSYQD